MPDPATYKELLRCYQILSRLDENERPLRAVAEGQPGWEASQKKLAGLGSRRAELDAAVAALEAVAALGVTPELLRAPARRETVRDLAAAYAVRKAPTLLRQGERGQKSLVAFVRGAGADAIADLADEALFELLRLLGAPGRELLQGAVKADAAEATSLKTRRW